MIEQNKVFKSKISVESSVKSGQMSLERLSWTNRDPSVNQKCSLVEVKSNQGQRKSDIFQRQLDERNDQFGMFNTRNSNSIFHSGIGLKHSINQQKNDAQQPKAQQRSAQHNCICYRQCSTEECPCFLAADQLCIKQQCCDMCIQLKYKMMQSNFTTCTCKNSKCLKSYCKCFQNNKFCGKYCKCEECVNQFDSEERQLALQQLKNQKNIQPMSCTCKKTKCNKKYCSCFANGVKCNSLCTCEGCKNSDGEQGMMQIENEKGCFFDDNQNNGLDMPQQIEFQPPKFVYQ